jgi:hypothetical protein
MTLAKSEAFATPARAASSKVYFNVNVIFIIITQT